MYTGLAWFSSSYSQVDGRSIRSGRAGSRVWWTGRNRFFPREGSSRTSSTLGSRDSTHSRPLFRPHSWPWSASPRNPGTAPRWTRSWRLWSGSKRWRTGPRNRLPGRPLIPLPRGTSTGRFIVIGPHATPESMVWRDEVKVQYSAILYFSSILSTSIRFTAFIIYIYISIYIFLFGAFATGASWGWF